MTTVNHSAAAGIHLGAYVQSSDPGAVGAGILWINTTGSAPFALSKRNSGNTGWDAVSPGVFVASGASHATGLVPDPGSSAGSTRFVREDGTWAVPPGSGAGAMTLISDQVLVSTAANITFSSIPGTYKHLRLELSLRSSNSFGNEDVWFNFNGDSSAIYYWQQTYFTATAVSSNGTGATKAVISETTAASATAHFFAGSVIQFLDYANATNFKTMVAQATIPQGYTFNCSGGWNSAAAITSIVLVPQTGGTWAAGCRASLYGIS